jgi:hypothetical protein
LDSSILVRFYCLALVLFIAACTTTPENILTRADSKILLLDPSKDLDESWEHQVLRKRGTTYTQFESRLGNTIKATGNVSASILYRVFEGIDLSCSTLEWNWFVEALQQTSDLRKKGLDDVGASILIAFGDPGPFRDNSVPTLKYVWANAKHSKNDIITGPYQAKYLRTIIVQTGPAAEYNLVRERRDLVSDYIEAFGKSPSDKIYAIGLFTDNDDTKEPITAHYGAITLICNPAKI